MVIAKLAWLKFPLFVYLGWRLIILLFQIFLQPLFLSSDLTATLHGRLYLSWITLWDSGHYLTIALKGYQFPDQAFFPLWPILIKTLSLSGLGVYKSAFLLSNLFSLTTFLLFYHLATILLDQRRAKLSLLLFAAFPTTMFLLAAYSEGLYLSLVLASFILVEKKLNFVASLLAGLTTATRPTGVAASLSLFPPTKNPWSKKSIYLGLSLLGILLYSAYQWRDFKDPLYFLRAQKERCQVHKRCSLTFPLKPLLDYSWQLKEGKKNIGLNPEFIDWASSIVFLALLYPIAKNLGSKYSTYSLLSLLLPLVSGSLVGMARYVLPAFPAFFVLPKIIKSKPLLIVLYLGFFTLQLGFLILFTNYLWVA